MSELEKLQKIVLSRVDKYLSFKELHRNNIFGHKYNGGENMMAKVISVCQFFCQYTYINNKDLNIYLKFKNIPEANLNKQIEILNIVSELIDMPDNEFIPFYNMRFPELPNSITLILEDGTKAVIPFSDIEHFKGSQLP